MDTELDYRNMNSLTAYGEVPTANKLVFEDLGWAVMEGETVTTKRKFYYLINNGLDDRTYVYIEKGEATILSRECNFNCKEALKNNRIPESIKDFLRTLVMLNEF